MCQINYFDFYLGTIPLLAGGRRGSLSEVDGCGTGGGGGFLKRQNSFEKILEFLVPGTSKPPTPAQNVKKQTQPSNL